MRRLITRQGEDWEKREESLDVERIRSKRGMSKWKAVWYLLRKGFGITHNIEETSESVTPWI